MIYDNRKKTRQITLRLTDDEYDFVMSFGKYNNDKFASAFKNMLILLNSQAESLYAERHDLERHISHLKRQENDYT